MENLKGRPSAEFGEMQARLDAELEEDTREDLEGRRRGCEKLVSMGLMKKEEIEPRIAEKEKEFLEMDSLHRVARLLNNFYFWFPGGPYRELLAERKLRDDSDKDKIAKDEMLIAELDAIIRESGYESVAENVAKRIGAEQERLKILVEVYLKMRDKGYERSRLSR